MCDDELRGKLERQTLRRREKLFRRDGGKLGEASAVDWRAHHAIAGSEALDALANSGHDAAELEAGNEGQSRFDLVSTGDHQKIRVVDAGRLDADDDLSGPGRRRG